MLDHYLTSHCIAPEHLRADDFESFMKARRKSLLMLIGSATGHPVSDTPDTPDEGVELSEDVARDNDNSATAA